MTGSTSPEPRNSWAGIEKEKRRDRFIRRVCVTAWSVTIVVVLIFGVSMALLAVNMMKSGGFSGMGSMLLLSLGMRFLLVLGILAALIATLSTVGLFLRMRTATLGEIQMRLAALEQMLSSRGDLEWPSLSG